MEIQNKEANNQVVQENNISVVEKDNNVNTTEDNTEEVLSPKERRKKALRKHLSIIPNSCTSMELSNILMSLHRDICCIP